MNKEEMGLFNDLWHIGTDMMSWNYKEPADKLKEKIIKTFEENQHLQNDLDSANSKVSALANKLLQIETIIKYDLKYYEKDVVVRDLNTILKMIGSESNGK